MNKKVPKRVEKFDSDDKTIVLSSQAQVLATKEGVNIERLIWEMKNFMHQLNVAFAIIKVHNGLLTFQIGFKPKDNTQTFWEER